MPQRNPYSKYIKQYQTSNITTATPEKLMIMLFDGAIQFLMKAKKCIEDKDYKGRAENIDGARKIIRELMRTIDLENGNDVSKNLFRLYNRMATNLIKANIQRNISLIDTVLEDLSNIRWGFQKAIEIKSGVTTVEQVMSEQAENGIANQNPTNIGSETQNVQPDTNSENGENNNVQ